MRVFLDTNVLVSAFATRGLCADLFRHVLVDHEFLASEVVIDELVPVLRTRIKLPVATIDEIVRFLRQFEWVARPEKPSEIPVRDPDDRWILASAIEGKAEVLVTGDRDLLMVADDAPLPVVDPRGFWTMLRSNQRDR